MSPERELIQEAKLRGAREPKPSTTDTASGVISASEPRRSGPRVRVRLDTQLSTLDADGDSSYTLTAAKTLDVADGGLALAVDEPMTVGLRVVVEIELGHGPCTERSGRIVRAFEDAAGCCFVAIAFDTVLDGLAAQASAPVATQRAGNVRI